MRENESAAPLRAIGHSAGGPGSLGAVYHFPDAPHFRTVAVFAAGADEGVAEWEALRIATGSRP